MLDPLSIAASVAGAVALAGAVSKSVLQFCSSVQGAPDEARHLVASLYTLNIALAQIQQNLLDPSFVTEAGDADVKALGECLLSCTHVFMELERKVDDSGLGSEDNGLPQDTWERTKWLFTDDVLDSYLRRVEAEKATLQHLTSAFTALVLIMRKLNKANYLATGKSLLASCTMLSKRSPGLVWSIGS